MGQNASRLSCSFYKTDAQKNVGFPVKSAIFTLKCKTVDSRVRGNDKKVSPWLQMGIFKLNNEYKPAGDQPQAIERLVEGMRAGRKFQTLMGVTGSGKTFTMANVIAQHDLPALVVSHNKTLAAQLYEEFKELFPENAVEYFVSYYDYYQPEAYIPQRDIYIEKDASKNSDLDRLRLPAFSGLVRPRIIRPALWPFEKATIATETTCWGDWRISSTAETISTFREGRLGSAATW